MNIIEVKNNLIKLCYEDELILSGFIKVSDSQNTYIAQVLHLEATRIGKVAIAKLIFKYNNGLSAYDGSIPSLRAELTPISSSVLLDTLEQKDPLNLCKLAQQPETLLVDFNLLKDSPIICAEKFYTTKVLLNNFALQLQSRNKKIVVFDTAGVFKAHKLSIRKDFRLPLNTSTINYIYEKGFEDATAESKAMIQSIFEELSEYSKSVEFIPFDTFKAVINSEFMRTRLIQLVILKNKIKQIGDWKVFAQNENDFGVLREKLQTENTVVVDISCLQESLQKECIKYVYSVLNSLGEEFYAFTPLSNENSDKFLLQQIFETENVHTTTICGYDYKYLPELKKSSKDMFMFTPLKQQKDFGGYNIFLQKLAEDEFIAYGKMTKFVPLISKLHQLKLEEIYVKKVTETIQKVEHERLVSQLASATCEEVVVPHQQTTTVNVVEPQPAPIETPAQEVVDSIEQEPVNQQVEEPAQPVEESVQEVEQPVEDVQIADPIVEEPFVAPQVDEVVEPVEENQFVEDMEQPIQEVEDAISDVSDDVIPVEEEPAEQTVEENTTVNEQSPLQQALDEVPEIEDDDELSDDDLDMIEELSKPDAEIPVINQEPAPQPQVVETPQPQVEEAPQVEEISQVEEVQEAPQPAPQPQPTPQPEPQSVDEEIQNATIPQPEEHLQTRANTTPVVPVYPSEIPDEDKVNSDAIKEGDRVFHEEFGEGVVEKMINYGDKLLCSVNFSSVGRRLLNPEISEMKVVR
jgi:hypothetical protein